MYHTFGPTVKRRESPLEIGKVRAKIRCVRMGPVFEIRRKNCCARAAPSYGLRATTWEGLTLTHSAFWRAPGRTVRSARRPGRIQRGSRSPGDRKSTRLNSSHPSISYAVFCLKKKKNKN